MVSSLVSVFSAYSLEPNDRWGHHGHQMGLLIPPHRQYARTL